MRWFGREPALWLGLIQAFVTLLVGFQFDWLSPGQASIWMSVVNALVAVVLAIRVRPVMPAVYTSAITIVATLLAAYGLHLSQELVASVNGLAVAFLFFWTRGQVSPEEDAHKTGVLGNKVTTGPAPD